MIEDRAPRGSVELTKWDIHGVKTSEWQGIRRRIIARDGNRCQLCSRAVGDGGLRPHVHHVNGITTDTLDANLTTLCPSCHARLGRVQVHYPWITPAQAFAILHPFAAVHGLSWDAAYSFMGLLENCNTEQIEEAIAGFVETMEEVFDELDRDEFTQPD